MDPSKKRERDAVGRLAELCRARGIPRSVLAGSLRVGENPITERFAGRTRTKAGDLLLMVEASGGVRDEDLAGVAGAFHPEIYLAGLEKRGDRQKRYAKSDVALTPPKRPYERGELRRVAAGLQELRLLDRRKARQQAFNVLRTIQFYPDQGDPEAAFDARRALAAIWRGRGNYSGAAAFLLAAFRLAGSNRILRARAFHALAPLARDVGDLDVALEATERAGTEYLAALDLRGVGRSLITRAQIHTYRGDLDDALTAFLAALPLVAEDAWYWCYAGFQNLAFCRLYRGELEEARASAGRALAALDSKAGEAPLLKSATLWLRGEILLRMDLPRESAADLEGVLGIYLAEKFRPLDAALVAIRLAHADHMSGNLEGLAKLTMRLTPVVDRMEKGDELTAASFAEFVCQAKRGEMSVEQLERTYREILRGAKEAPPMAQLAVMPLGSNSGPVASTGPAPASNTANIKTASRT